jgi:hypothetical protein
VCPKGYVALSTELTKLPVCLASRAFIKRKLKLIHAEGGSHEQVEAVVAKACICHDLGGGATRKLGIEHKSTPAICPGPNIVHFKRALSLEELVAHIYGRGDLLTEARRPHMFVAELRLNIDKFKADARKLKRLDVRHEGRENTTLANLRKALEHYRTLINKGELCAPELDLQLSELEDELQAIASSSTAPMPAHV